MNTYNQILSSRSCYNCGQILLPEIDGFRSNAPQPGGIGCQNIRANRGLPCSNCHRQMQAGGKPKQKKRGQYPPEWDERRLEIKRLAGWKCENCKEPHNPDIASGKCLTVHHLDGKKWNCSYENLVALCQVCHLRIQAKYHPSQMWLLTPRWAILRNLK